MSYYRSGNYVVEISYDECAENPREWGRDETDWHLVCAEHRRYNLPHETHETLSSKEMSENPDYEVRPLSFIDHSGVALVEGVRDGWDVCPCGYAWRKRGEYDVELSDVLDMWNTWANGGVMTATLYDLDGNILERGCRVEERRVLSQGLPRVPWCVERKNWRLGVFGNQVRSLET